MVGNKPLELPNQRAVSAEVELGVDPLLERDHAQLVQPSGLEPGELLLEVSERRAAPEPERLPEQLPTTRGLAAARACDQALEPVRVDRVRLHREPIAGRLRHQDLPPQRLPQPGDRVLQ